MKMILSCISRLRVLALALLLLPSIALAERTEYKVDYLVRFLPAKGQADVSIRLTPGTGEVRRLRLRMPEDRYSNIRGDGEVTRKGDLVTWLPPRGEPARLRFLHHIDHKRRDGGYDARITDDWVLMRGDDLVPPATVLATKGADSRARLRFQLPKGWTNVDTPFKRSRDGKSFVVVNPERNFDRPTGWIIAGDVGTRREQFDNIEISVAGPKGDEVRRNDMLAFFNVLVPEFEALYGKLPLKVLIVSAGDPMWRGGLSGPRSLYLHADRPVISENGTSTLVHELTHVFTRLRGADGDDWITEAVAEYYSIELMRRAGLLSPARADKAQEWMARHSRQVTSLTSNRSYGPRTARGVQLLRELDAEIRKASKGKRSLDDLVRAVLPLREVSREDLREEAARLIGRPSKVLGSELLD
ncbi:hypothetical protein [Arenimonas donghaensis]|uniref:Peptidase M61 catalytic domain-containing protein n=1 Tax=Arenimonas donghaensis DSM 18148 = HO3-R19 TaxID=1121014 RepID=A0A087MFZ0_9GAMM|nr:hypothetical protein [Arenimonas donghaensis]KFL35793.1 hypothetical protein N788_07035 [Arenimonas donghaensis DSM 18148 = HO3-R19]